MTDQVINIDGNSTRELVNDVVEITFHSNVEADTAEEVQQSLREAIHTALETVRPHLITDEVDVSTDRFQVEPRYNKSGKMDGYQGFASITVKGTDTAKIAQLASDIKTMVVATSQNSVSQKLKQSVEAVLMEEAILDFQSKADIVTKAFGFKSWTLGTVHVSTNSGRRNFSSGKVMALGGATESSSMEIETGKSTMNGNVRGTIILSLSNKS